MSKEKKIENKEPFIPTARQNLIFTICFCVFIWFLIWGTPTSDTQPKMSRADKAFILTEVSKDGIRARLKDPKSAIFKNVYYVDHLTPAVCGEVNSRNSFGGMSGFQSFLARGEDLILFEREADDFGTVWNKLCVK